MSDAASSQKKIFSYREALELMPEVRRATETAYHEVEALRAQLEQAAHDSDAIERRMGDAAGAWYEAMAAHGLEVKGLWLVDFDNGSGYYCWRWPETKLEFFHTYEEGFDGRMRIQ